MPLPLPPTSPRIDNPAVVVIGGANIDQKWQSLEHPTLGSSNPAMVQSSVGGVGRNVAENLTRLGATVALITAVGDDSEGDRIRREADAAGVDMRYVIVTSESTGIYTAILDPSGEMVIAASAMDAMEWISAAAVTARRALIANTRCLVLDCNVPVDGLVRAAELAADHEVSLVIDPVSVTKARAISTILGHGLPIHTITPNLAELLQLTGGSGSSREELCEAAAQLHAAGVATVWVSIGANGSFVSVFRDGTQQVEMIAALPARLVDATGGGDAMLAGYVTGILRGLNEFDSARLGRAAAAITIESIETVSPSLNMAALLARAGGVGGLDGAGRSQPR